MTPANPKYWLVWREYGGAPTVKHATPQEARAEAARLATQNPGCRFVVLAAREAFVGISPEPVRTVFAGRSADFDEIPF